MSAVVFGLVYSEADSWHDGGSWELSCPEISVNKWDKTAATKSRNHVDSLVFRGALDFCYGGYRLSGQESATIQFIK